MEAIRLSDQAALDRNFEAVARRLAFLPSDTSAGRTTTQHRALRGPPRDKTSCFGSFQHTLKQAKVHLANPIDRLLNQCCERLLDRAIVRSDAHKRRCHVDVGARMPTLGTPTPLARATCLARAPVDPQASLAEASSKVVV